jgi:hypothetical protein
VKNLVLKRSTVDNYLKIREREKKLGINLLKEELAKATMDETLVCILCDFVATCEQTCTLLREAEKNSTLEEPIPVSPANVTALKLLSAAISTIRRIVVKNYNLSLQIH